MKIFTFYKYIIFLWLFSVYSSLYAVNILPSDVSLLKHSEIFIDDGAKKSLGQIRQNPSFHPVNTDFLSFGYLSDQAIWIRFKLDNPGNKSISRNLHIDNSMLDWITLYENNGTSHTVGALARPPYDGIVDFYFPITIDPHTTLTYYLRLQSNSCATYFHLTSETIETLWQKNYQRSIILIFFMGVMLTLVVYNAFIYAFTRERVYLYYVFFLFLLTYNHYFSYSGMLFPLFKPFHLANQFLTWYADLSTLFGTENQAISLS